MAHQYTVEELNKEYGEAWQEIRDVNDYHVLYEIKNNGNNKNVVIGCSNMLHALKYISGNYYEMIKEKFTTQQLQEWGNAINNAIASIENEKIDENIDINLLNIETEENGISIVNAGYWDSFAEVTPKLIYGGTLIEQIETNHIVCELMRTECDAVAVIAKEKTIEFTELSELRKRLLILMQDKIDKGIIEVFDENDEYLDLEMKELEAEINRRDIIISEYENEDKELITSDDNLEQLHKLIDEYEIMIDKLKILIDDDVDIYSPEFIINFNNICKEI
jgi:hypothetical protein